MNKKILIIEDELFFAHHLKTILQTAHYDIIITKNNTLNESIASIQENKPDLILVHLNPHNNKGLMLGSYLLQKDTIPYVYYTNHDDKTTLDTANNTRPYGYLIAPFNPDNVVCKLSVIMHNHACAIKKEIVTSVDISKVPFRIKESLKYIDNHIDTKIDIQNLCDITQWKKHYFIKHFSVHVGLTPYQYILIKKVEKAKYFLEETKVPITQIATRLGFESHSNFCNAFKKIIKMTPNHFRNQYA
jgi:AraC-like DNA-binding protein